MLSKEILAFSAISGTFPFLPFSRIKSHLVFCLGNMALRVREEPHPNLQFSRKDSLWNLGDPYSLLTLIKQTAK